MIGKPHLGDSPALMQIGMCARFLKFAEGALEVLVLAALLALPGCASEKTVGKSSFVFILVDDMGQC